jgi:signal transduction histidine kinase
VVSQAIELVRPSLRQRRQALGADLDLRCLLDPQLPRVVGGAADLRHVFVNLLLNARDAMPRGGAVEIAARRERGAVVVEVADSGVGIAPDHLPHLFDPFFTTRPGQGTGLGLAMCAGVMRRLGGQIEAANRPGGGAVFRLRFPLAPLARAEAPAGRLRPPGARRRGTGGGAAHPR